MPRIKNKLFQPLTILLEGAKTLYLQPREQTEVSRSDLNSSHLRSSIRNADVAVIEEGEKPEPAAPPQALALLELISNKGEERHA